MEILQYDFLHVLVGLICFGLSILRFLKGFVLSRRYMTATLSANQYQTQDLTAARPQPAKIVRSNQASLCRKQAFLRRKHRKGRWRQQTQRLFCQKGQNGSSGNS